MGAQSGFVTHSNSTQQIGWWRRHPYAVAAIVALAVRVALIFIRRTYVFPPSDPFAFGMETGSIARSLAMGEGFSSPFRGSTGPTAWIAPLYPAMCAAVFKLLGVYSTASAICILGLNSIFSALTCFAIGAIARRTVGDRVGIISAFVWAVLPHFAKWPTEWAWDMSLSALLAGVAIWLTLLLADEDNWQRWIGFGTLWAAITLSNPSLLTLLPVCALWLAMRRHDATFWRRAAVSALLCAALVAPWMVRNRMALGRWVFVRDNFGFELHMGNYHFSNGMGWRGTHPAGNPAEYAKYRSLGELAYIEQTGRAAREFIRQYPGEFADLCWIRATGFWNGNSMGYSPNPWPWTPGTFLFASLLALAGLLWATVSRVHGAALFWWMAIYPLPYYITYPQTRYRHAIEPEMLLLSVYVVAVAAERIRSRRATARSAAAA
jgi:4-amino-4-deoxy-L-arabinose transferase-like glycosyltransferase